MGTLREDFIEQRGLALLLLAAILVSFFAGLGSVPLFDLDEGAFTEATREMLERGDYISTYLNGVPRYDKPVLIYWLQALSVRALGSNEWAFRLPSAICATLWVVFVFLFVRRLRGAPAAFLAAGFTATAAGITVIGRAAIADALLNMLIVGALASAYLYLSGKHKAWLRACFVAIALGLLAKGPVAVLIPLAVTFLYCLSKRELANWLRAVLDPAGIALLLAIAAPWYVAQYLKEGDAFIQGFIIKHNVGRFSAPMHGFDGSLLYYLPWLPLATLPFTTPLLNVFRQLRSIWADDLQRFCLIWFGFVLVFFSFSGTKLPHYAFYGYSGLFILMAVNAERLRSSLLALLPALLLFAALAALPWGIEHYAGLARDPYYRDALADAQAQFGPAFYAFLAFAGAATLALIAAKRLPLANKLIAVGVLQAAVIVLFILPAVGAIQQSPVKEAALLARSRGYAVVMWGVNTPSFIVYSGKLVERRDPVPGDVVFSKVKRLRELPGYELLYEKNGFALVKVTVPAQ